MLRHSFWSAPRIDWSLLGTSTTHLPTPKTPRIPTTDTATDFYMKMQVPIRPEVHRAASSSKRVSISLSPSQRHNGNAIKSAVSRPLTPMYKFPDSPIEASTPYNSLAQPIPGSRSHVSVKRHGTPFGEGLTRRLKEWQSGRDEGERRSIPLSPPPMRGNTPASIHEISARLTTSMMLHSNTRG